MSDALTVVPNAMLIKIVFNVKSIFFFTLDPVLTHVLMVSMDSITSARFAFLNVRPVLMDRKLVASLARKIYKYKVENVLAALQTV